MRSAVKLLNITIIGGAVFLIPLVLIVVVLGKAFQIIKVLAQPLRHLFPIDAVAGIALVDVLTLVLMVVLCLLAGLVARSGFGRKLHAKIDAVLLVVFPGYGWIKGVTGTISDRDAAGILKPVVARLDDQTLIGFEVDRSDDDLVAIYVPGAPDPRAGTLCYMTADRVQPIDAGLQPILKSFKALGRGSASMLAGTASSKDA